ncbi:unnamed protein product [Pleuronectes platessa]|uniref:Uncharacterized protein n=1 Tax=Pleuronectes platessa TaxID=8262 RepID=A0A9N7TGF6_PLEPL|nr:unnamed protein product [Pleuronectes platessa]
MGVRRGGVEGVGRESQNACDEDERRTVDGYCQRSGHPSVKPFSTLEEGRGERGADRGGAGGRSLKKMGGTRGCLLAYHKGTIKPSQCKAHSLQINSSAAALD